MVAIMQRAPWNKDRLTGQKRPLKPRDVWAIRVRLRLQLKQPRAGIAPIEIVD